MIPWAPGYLAGAILAAALAARIRTEYQAGNMTEVERLIGRVNRNARSLDVDLRETTVEIIHLAGAR